MTELHALKRQKEGNPARQELERTLRSVLDSGDSQHLCAYCGSDRTQLKDLKFERKLDVVRAEIRCDRCAQVDAPIITVGALILLMMHC